MMRDTQGRPSMRDASVLVPRDTSTQRITGCLDKEHGNSRRGGLLHVILLPRGALVLSEGNKKENEE